ncbi:hypothetical protein [Parapedobacter indicus]|uniref:DUF4890 domain-containing protein n=1 Tax=Parapedobacter indicus TaxID=1477437 RepID=A0A1I3II39_9SPHI|nr:hypothetical protein [Parapedobacter indicus]PPL02174.1 hypothetical protein CLV26_10499 [Parapedobacter indicus]SFI47497.1 hypothetical protein SAMN05444682_10499 [Parapedobacter indicus]
MRNAALITLLISAITFTAFGQEHRVHRQSKSAEEIAKTRTDQLTESLGLNEKQQKEVYALNLERAEKIKTARKDRLARGEAMRDEMKADRERLNSILTEEQREMLKQQQADRAAKFKARQEGRKDGRFRDGKSRNRMK